MSDVWEEMTLEQKIENLNQRLNSGSQYLTPMLTAFFRRIARLETTFTQRPLAAKNVDSTEGSPIAAEG